MRALSLVVYGISQSPNGLGSEGELMCLTPILTPKGYVVGCGKCNRCRDNKVKDMVGRCILESKTAVATTSVTLTYGEDDQGNTDHFRARYLVLNDFNRFRDLARWHGYPLSYFACGEYGKMKGRAHWHAVVFWRKCVPSFQAGELLYGEAMKDGDPYPVGVNFKQRFWPHGWSYWEPGDFKSIKYVAKYMLKDQSDENALSRVMYSRRPLLGAAGLIRLAGQYVEQGLVPNKPVYWFPEVKKKRGPDKGKPLEFYISGASLDLFAESFENQWRARYGTHPPRAAAASQDHEGGSAVKGLDRDWLVDFSDSNHRPSKEEILAWVPDIPERRKAVATPWKKPPGGAAVEYSRGEKCYYYCDPEGVRVFWSFDSEGNRQWRKELVSEPEGLRRRAEAELQKELDRKRQNSSGLFRQRRDG